MCIEICFHSFLKVNRNSQNQLKFLLLFKSTVNNLEFGRSVDETLRVLQAIQYIQNNPDEVCPANWQPGDKTMISNPVKSKEYFQAI